MAASGLIMAVRPDPGATAMKILTRVAMLLALAAALGACNTVQGMGKDIKKAGEKIEETATR
jgi:predicted small secreted protein